MPVSEQDFLAGRYGAAPAAAPGPRPLAPVAPGASEYDAFAEDHVRSLEEDRQARMRSAITAAARGNPDTAAEQHRLMRTSGLPLRVIERDMEDIKAREFTRGLDIARLAAQSPILAQQLTDPAFTRVAVDDIPNLSTLEQSVGRAVRYMMGADSGGGIFGTARASVHGTAEAFASVKGAAVDLGDAAVSPLLGPDNWFRRMGDFYRGQSAVFHQRAEAARPKASPASVSSWTQASSPCSRT